MPEKPAWREYRTNNLFEIAEERPLDRLIEARGFLHSSIVDAGRKLEPRVRRLEERFDAAFDEEEQRHLQGEWGDIAFEWELFSHAPRRLGWALFLAGHSAYEVELVELAYGDAAARKYADEAIAQMKDGIRSIIRDPDDLHDEVRRLRSLRDEFAHGGGRFREGSPHQQAVEAWLHVGPLGIEELAGKRMLVFSDGGFESVCQTMNQVVRVARAAARGARR